MSIAWTIFLGIWICGVAAWFIATSIIGFEIDRVSTWIGCLEERIEKLENGTDPEQEGANT